MIYLYSNTYNGFTAVLFQFIRVGSDRSTAQLLLDLDQDPDLAEFVGVLPFKFNPEYQPEDKWDIVCYNQLLFKLIALKRRPH